jgi:hypothetical protein
LGDLGQVLSRNTTLNRKNCISKISKKKKYSMKMGKEEEVFRTMLL